MSEPAKRSRLRSFIQALFGSSDVTTEHGRAVERRRRAILSVITSVGARGAGLLVFVLGSRIALSDLGPTRFGVWMTISSLLMLLGLLDLGVSNSLVTTVAKAASEGDRGRVSTVIASGLVLTAAIAAAAFVLLAAIVSIAPLGALFKDAPAAALAEARTALLWFCGLFSASMPLQAAHRVMAGLQRAYVAHAASLLASAATCVLLIMSSGHDLSVSAYILMTFGLQTLSGAVLCLLLWREGRIDLRAASRLGLPEYRRLLSTGGLFLALQLGMLFGWGMDQVLISSTLGPSSVAAYAVAMRIYLLVSLPVSTLNAPLWAAYADAFGRGDASYIRRTASRSLATSAGIGVIGGVVVLLWGSEIWSVFTDGEIPFPATLMYCFAAWTVLECLGNALAMFLNGLHILREQVFTVFAFVLLSLPAKIFTLTYAGLAYLPAVTAAVYFLTHVVGYGIIFRRRLITRMYGTVA